MAILLSLVGKRTEESSFPQIKTLHSQCNTLHGLRYYEQSYCKDNQIYTIFGPHEQYL